MKETKLKEIAPPTLEQLKARAYDLVLYRQVTLESLNKEIAQLQAEISKQENEKKQNG